MLFRASAALVLPARWIATPQIISQAVPPLNFWQQLASEGVGALGLVIDTGDPMAGRPSRAREESRPPPGCGLMLEDEAGARALIVQEFAAKVAAARLCTSRAALGAVVAALCQEQRSRLAALQARQAARRDGQAAKALAQHYRRLAEMVARGVPSPARPLDVEAVQQRIRAAIMRNRPG